MAVKLDDVMWLLNILIIGNMMRHDEHTFYEYGVELITMLLDVDKDIVIQITEK
jgi:hypothetical protein